MKTIAKNGDYLIKRLGLNNLSDLVKLHIAVYGRVHPIDFFSKKYDTAYTGTAYIGFIAYNTEMMPIAYYGVIPCFIRSGDEVILTAQSADTMTHPKYRKQGLYVLLAEQTYELCRHSGIRFVFGFPNQNSLPGALENLKWKKTDTMDCFVIPVRAVPLERLTVKMPSLSGLYTWYKRLVLKKYLVERQAASSSVLANGNDGIFRDEFYMRYKTYSETQMIRIQGTTLWIKINSVLLIGDVLEAKNDLPEVIKELQKLAGKLGLRQIHFHTSPHTQLHRLFAAHYKATPSFAVLFKDIKGESQVGQIKFTSADIDTF